MSGVRSRVNANRDLGDKTAELKPKTRLVSAGTAQGPRVGEAVARSEAEIGIQPISELLEVEGIDVVGPLPAELQSPDLVYVAGAPYVSEQPIAAKALIDFLADPRRRRCTRPRACNLADVALERIALEQLELALEGAGDRPGEAARDGIAGGRSSSRDRRRSAEASTAPAAGTPAPSV